MKATLRFPGKVLKVLVELTQGTAVSWALAAQA